uniref:Uncharacterized protein n=2 Tax=Aegilops tauschii subsp. strangulata TaxID=200361 RepID=A0A453S383_AEGTS
WSWASVRPSGGGTWIRIARPHLIRGPGGDRQDPECSLATSGGHLWEQGSPAERKGAAAAILHGVSDATIQQWIFA